MCFSHGPPQQLDCSVAKCGEVPVEACTDSSEAVGVAQRCGPGKIRDLEAGGLWMQIVMKLARSTSSPTSQRKLDRSDMRENDGHLRAMHSYVGSGCAIEMPDAVVVEQAAGKVQLATAGWRALLE